MKRSLHEVSIEGGTELDKRRGSASARRSFFRRKKHQRQNSNDSKELPTYSSVSLNSEYSASTTIEG